MSIGKQYLLSFTTFFNSTKGYMITFNLHENVENRNEFPYEFLPWNRYEALIMDDTKQGIKSKVSTGILYPVHRMGDIVDVEGELDGNLASAGLLDYFARVNQYIQTTGSALNDVVNSTTEQGATDFFYKLTDILEDAKAEVVVNVIKESGSVVTVFKEAHHDEDEVIKVLRFAPTYDIDVLKGDQAYSTLEGTETRYTLTEKQEKLFEVLAQTIEGAGSVKVTGNPLTIETAKEGSSEVEIYDPKEVESVGEVYGSGATEVGEIVRNSVKEKTERVQRKEPLYGVDNAPFTRTETFLTGSESTETEESEPIREVQEQKVTSASRLMQILYGDKVVEQIKAEFRTVMDTYEEEVAQFGAIRAESLVDLIGKSSESPTTDVELNELEKVTTFRQVDEKGELVSADTYQVADMLNIDQSILTRNVDLESFREAKSFLYSWVDTSEQPTNVVKEEVTITQLDTYAENISVVHATVSLFIDMFTYRDTEMEEFEEGGVVQDVALEEVIDTETVTDTVVEDTEESTTVKTEFVAVDELFSASESSAHTDVHVSEIEKAGVVYEAQEVRTVLGNVLADADLDSMGEADIYKEAYDHRLDQAKPDDEGLEAVEYGTEKSSLALSSVEYDIASTEYESGYGFQEGAEYVTEIVADSIKYVQEVGYEAGQTNTQAEVDKSDSGFNIVGAMIDQAEEPNFQERETDAEIEAGTDPEIIYPEADFLTQDKPNDSFAYETSVDFMKYPTPLAPIMLHQEMKNVDSDTINYTDILWAVDSRVNKGAEMEIDTADPGQFLYPQGEVDYTDHGISMIEQDIDKLVGESGITQSGQDLEYQEIVSGSGQAESEGVAGTFDEAREIYPEGEVQGQDRSELTSSEALGLMEEDQATHVREEEAEIGEFDSAGVGTYDAGGIEFATQALRKVEEFTLTRPAFPLSVITLLPSREELTKAITYYSETEGDLSREEARIIDHLAEIAYEEAADPVRYHTDHFAGTDQAETVWRDNVEVFILGQGEDSNVRDADHQSREEFTLVDHNAKLHEIEYDVTEGKRDSHLDETQITEEGFVRYGYKDRDLSEGAKFHGSEAVEETIQQGTHEVVLMSDKPHTIDEAEGMTPEAEIEEVEKNVDVGSYESVDSGREGAFYRQGHEAEVDQRTYSNLRDFETTVYKVEDKVIEGGRESLLESTEKVDSWFTEVGHTDRQENASVKDPEVTVEKLDDKVSSGGYLTQDDSLENADQWFREGGVVDQQETSDKVDPRAEIEELTTKVSEGSYESTVESVEGSEYWIRGTGDIDYLEDGQAIDKQADIVEVESHVSEGGYETEVAETDKALQIQGQDGYVVGQEHGQVIDPEALVQEVEVTVNGGSYESELGEVENATASSHQEGHIENGSDGSVIDPLATVDRKEAGVSQATHEVIEDRLEGTSQEHSKDGVIDGGESGVLQDPQAIIEISTGAESTNTHEVAVDGIEGSEKWDDRVGVIGHRETGKVIDPYALVDEYEGAESSSTYGVEVLEAEGASQGSQTLGEVVSLENGNLNDPQATIEDYTAADSGSRYESELSDLDTADHYRDSTGELGTREEGRVIDPHATIEEMVGGAEGGHQEAYLSTAEEESGSVGTETADIVTLEDMVVLDKEIDVQELEDFITWINHESNTYDMLEKAGAIDKFITIDRLEESGFETGVDAEVSSEIEDGTANVRLEAEVLGSLEDARALDKEIEIGDYESAVNEALNDVYLTEFEEGFGTTSLNATIDRSKEMTILDGEAEVVTTDSGYVVTLAEALHSTIESAGAGASTIATIGSMEIALSSVVVDSLFDVFEGAEVGLDTETDMHLIEEGGLHRTVFADLPDRFEESTTANSGREADIADFDSTVVENAVDTYLNEVSGSDIHKIYEVAIEDGELAFVGNVLDTDIVDILEEFRSLGMYAWIDQFAGGTNETSTEVDIAEIEEGLNETIFIADDIETEVGAEPRQGRDAFLEGMEVAGETSLQEVEPVVIEEGTPTYVGETYHHMDEEAIQADQDFFIDVQEYEGAYNTGKGSEGFIEEIYSADDGNMYWDTHEPKSEQASGEVDLETVIERGFDLALVNQLRFEGYYHEGEVADHGTIPFEAVVASDEQAGVNTTAVDTYIHTDEQAGVNTIALETYHSIDEHAKRLKKRITLPEEDEVASKERRKPVFIEEDDWAGRMKSPVILYEDEQAGRMKSPVVLYEDEQAGRLPTPVIIGEDEQAQRVKTLVEMVQDEESVKTKVPIKIEDVQSGDKSEVRRRVDLVEDEHAVGLVPEDPPYEEPREPHKMWLIMGKQFPAWSGWNPKKTR